MQEFKLPDLGEGMQEAEIRRWLVHTGDTIALDQPMLEVETDKAVVEIPAPTAGRISAIHVQEGALARLGQVLVSFEQSSQTPQPTSKSSAQGSQTTDQHSISSPSIPKIGTEEPVNRRILAAPAVRKRAFELDIDLAQVPSTHPTGRVTAEDLQLYTTRTQEHPTSTSSSLPASTSASVLSPVMQNGHHEIKSPIATKPALLEERQPLTGLRRRIAEHMELSWRTIPHATAFDELDGTELATLRQQLKPLAEQHAVRLTYLPLLVKLLLPALKEFPIFNASFDEKQREIVYKYTYHVGIATDSPEGLLVPVLRNTDQLSILQIATQLEHLIAGAQKRTLTLNEVTGSTFTLNNIGSFGGSSGTPIINHPEVAILAVGRLQEKAVVHDGAIVSRLMLPLALSFDHRVIDGALAGKFLARFKSLVEQPQQLLLDLV